jgi:hypothetical protein
MGVPTLEERAVMSRHTENWLVSVDHLFCFENQKKILKANSPHGGCRVLIFKVTGPSPLPPFWRQGFFGKGPRAPPPRSTIQNPSLPRRPIPRLYCPGLVGPELLPGIGVLPGPATGSHVVNRGTPVAPQGQPQLNDPGKRSHPVGGPGRGPADSELLLIFQDSAQVLHSLPPPTRTALY